MVLDQLQERKLVKIKKALSEVFKLDFNFNAEVEKLENVQSSTKKLITKLEENGVEVTDRYYQKLLLVTEGLKMAIKEAKKQKDNTVKENKTIKESDVDLDSAEVLLAAKQMADDLQKMAENLASMQVEDLMSITNAMKEEVGMAEAEAFSASAEAAIGAALDSVKSANDQVNNAVLVAQGGTIETDMDMDMAVEPAMDMDMDAGIDVADDEFAGADAADITTDETGREFKEDAYVQAIRMVKEAQDQGKVSKELLKKAFAVLSIEK
jgi:hypothetical protein|tara:strand:+ start:2521 stop:3321 length:801 start_codon:yes stop_codon:yes gene_type:complete